MEYKSIYAPFINDFINYKRGLGYKYESEMYTFRIFDCFLINKEVSSIGLTKELVELWAEKRPNESNKTRYTRLATISCFSVYLNNLGYVSHIPKLPSKKSDFIPYIFSHEQIEKFFIAVDSLDITYKSITTHIYPALFRLLYGCGLRISEALSLECSDVNLEENYLIIRKENAKNQEERIIPFTESLSEVLTQYNEYVKTYRLRKRASNYFFVNKYGQRCNRSTAYEWFRKVLFVARIQHNGKGPRLHDLRHTFCVHSLINMNDEKLDLYYALPILSKYVGHKNLEATERYIHLTSEMLPKIVDKMELLNNTIFPEVQENEE